jgi:CTP:molybdopterin cytidylyltransferase MocA
MREDAVVPLPMDPITGIVLAAGHSTRMGHPKALTRIRGATALKCICDTYAMLGVVTPVVVLGVHHDAVLAALPQLRVRIVRNPDADAGRTGSLQLALRETSARVALVWPVDHPLATAATARALLATRGAWVAPTFDGRGGHPIVLRDAALDAVRAAAPDAPLRDALHAAGVEATRVAVDDAGVVANIDTPADAGRWAKGTGPSAE